MHCENCSNAVAKAILSVDGVETASVDLTGATATWTNKNEATPASANDIKKAISAIGFDPE